MRSLTLSALCLALCAPALVEAQGEPRPGIGLPPERLPAQLKAERAERPLRSGTVGRQRLAITPPGYYDLSVSGDFDLGGSIFRNGYPFIHQDGGVYNTAVGTDALISLTTGYYNVAFGYRALRDNQTGFGNTGVGGVALLSNTSGFGNTAIGDMTLRQNLGGNYNTAIGQYALLSSSSASNNTAVGHSAMLYNSTSAGNTAIGVDALRYNTTGAGSQTAIGYQAARASYGYENTAIGARALYSATSGYRNVAIGSEALYFVQTGGGNIAIGHRAGFNLTSTSAGNILIGNEGPAVAENQTIRIGESQTRAFIDGIRGVTTDIANAVPVLIDTAGQLGTTSSSRRFKEEVAEMGSASEPVLELRPVTFRFRREFADGAKPLQFGLIAEEVAETFPELVVYDAEGRPETVKYHLLSILLLNELQRERQGNVERDQRLAELEMRLSSLEPAP